MGIHFALSTDQPPSAADLDGLRARAWPPSSRSFGVPYFVGLHPGDGRRVRVGPRVPPRDGPRDADRPELPAGGSGSAKFVVVGAWVLVVALVTMLRLAAGRLAVAARRRVPIFTAATGERSAAPCVYTLLFTWLAAAFTALVRNQTAALVLLFLWPLAVENVVSVVFALVPALRAARGA